MTIKWFVPDAVMGSTQGSEPPPQFDHAALMLEEQCGRCMLFHLHAQEDRSLLYETWSSTTAEVTRCRRLCTLALDFDAVDAIFRRAAKELVARGEMCVPADALNVILEHSTREGGNLLSWVELTSSSPLKACPPMRGTL